MTTFHSTDWKHFVRYKVQVKEKVLRFRFLNGLQSDQKGYIHLWKDYNTFDQKLTVVPSGARRVPIKKDILHDFFCGSKTRLMKDITAQSPCRGKAYFTHLNGGRPYLVCLSPSSMLTVYTIPSRTHYILEKDVSRDQHKNRWMYIERVLAPTRFLKSWIGKSPKNQMTEFSGGYGRRFLGNSCLFHHDKNKYIFVGHKVFSFTTRSPIVSFVSPVGNSDVPYPFAIDQEGNAYLFLEEKILPRLSYDTSDPYDSFYSDAPPSSRAFSHSKTIHTPHI